MLYTFASWNSCSGFEVEDLSYGYDGVVRERMPADFLSDAAGCVAVSHSNCEREMEWTNAMIWNCLGIIFLALGAVGVLLPLLPTTPFVLLAAACFAKSSPAWHAWLLKSRIFGPMLLEWEQNRCVSLQVKTLAITVIVCIGGPTMYLGSSTWGVRIFYFVLLAIGVGVVLSLKVCRCGEDKDG